MMNEEVVTETQDNQSAPSAQPEVKAETSPLTQQSVPDVSDTPKSNPTATPAKAVVTKEQVGQTGTSPEPWEKNYNELRKTFTKTSQENALTRKELAALREQNQKLVDMISKATEKPYDPDQFMEDMRVKGPDFLKKHFEEQLTAREKAWKEENATRDRQIQDLVIDNTTAKMKADSKNYPDFDKLEPEMMRLLDSGVIPESDVQTKPIPEILHTLYTQARLQHSQDAIKAAEQLGRKATEAELAREARAGVAGGGRVTGQVTADPKNMSAAELKKHFTALGMAE